MTKLTTLFALVFCLACGGSQTNTVVDPVDVTGTPPAASASAFDYMQANTFGYAEVSVSRGLQSPYFGVIQEATDSMMSPDQRAVRDRAIAFAQLVDHVYLGFVPNESGTDTDLGIAVVEGRFTIQNVIDFIVAMEPSETPQRSQVGAYEAVSVDDVTLVNVGNGRFVFGPHARATALALNPPRSGFHSRPFFTDAEGRIDAEAIVRVISERPEGLASLDRDIDSEFGEGASANVRGVAFSADGLNGIQIRGSAMTADAATAQILEGKMNEMRQQALQEPMLAAFGLRSIVESISITSDATSVSASINVTDADVRRLIQMGMGVMAMGAQPTTPPAPPPVTP